jgi:hypothetical protein
VPGVDLEAAEAAHLRLENHLSLLLRVHCVPVRGYARVSRGTASETLAGFERKRNASRSDEFELELTRVAIHEGSN